MPELSISLLGAPEILNRVLTLLGQPDLSIRTHLEAILEQLETQIQSPLLHSSFQTYKFVISKSLV